MDIQRLETALRNADAAGDVEAAKMLASEINRVRAAAIPQEPQKQFITPAIANEKYGLPNWLGVPEERNAMSHAASQGALFGFGDEIDGAGAALTAKVKSFFTGDDVDLGEAYRDFRDASRYKVDRFSKENPGTALAAEVAGSLLTGGVGAARTGAIKAGDTLLKNAGRVAGTGAAFGGVTGAGVSEAETMLKVYIDDCAKFGTVNGRWHCITSSGIS